MKYMDIKQVPKVRKIAVVDESMPQYFTFARERWNLANGKLFWDTRLIMVSF